MGKYHSAHLHHEQPKTVKKNSKSSRGGENMVQKKKKHEKAERKRESCQWKWAVLQEASGWACENHISLFSEQ